MKARVIEPLPKPKPFRKLELIIETPQEADMLWMLLALSHHETEMLIRGNYSDCPNPESMYNVSLEMFNQLDNKYTPNWYKGMKGSIR